jgi:proline iminopeptidase
MTDTVRDLADERPVWFYDQLGGGRSDRAADPGYYSLERFVDELAAVRAALSLAEVWLLGFSWGTALICAYMLARRPAGVKGLILSGPLLSTPLWDRDQRAHIVRMPASARAAIEAGEAAGDYGEAYQEAMMAYYRRHVCVLNPWPDSLNEALARLSPEVYQSLWGPSEFTCTGKLKDLDLSGRLGEIAEPVLLTCGDADEADPRTVKAFQLAFPRAAMAVLPRASHLHQLERPELYKATLRDFLRG